MCDLASHWLCEPGRAPRRMAAAIPSTFPAMSFPFPLDDFQRIALAALEARESVLVAAHTSAGKTVVALYAVALSLARRQRVVYTSPIKALSNQKYRELREAFGDNVGLMTGDVTLNPAADVLVMTTEILRNMLYRGSEVVREVAWVVFDEVHYMRDKSRGVVWEETIILLPPNARFVFLSATIPNALEFAAWIAAVHEQPCHVVSTPARPTPLHHYIHPAGSDGLYLISGPERPFDGPNLARALASAKAGAAARGRRGGGEMARVVKALRAGRLLPAIVFSFSRKQCESLAAQAIAGGALGRAFARSGVGEAALAADAARVSAVETIFASAIAQLSDADQALPQVSRLLPLLVRGVGLHHSGLLPLLKEVVELLFQEGHIRLLFATETFAMGVNMPARTVVFATMRKWDGEAHRMPSPSEYTQMAGRAGRRGLDAEGHVILMCEAEPDFDERQLERVVRGTSEPLTSSFKLRYNTILKLLAMEAADPFRMVALSFFAFQREAELRGAARDALGLPPLPADNLGWEHARADGGGRGGADAGVASAARARLPPPATPLHSLRYLTPGRLVRVARGRVEWGWGLVVAVSHCSGYRLARLGDAPQSQSADEWHVDVLLPLKLAHAEGGADADAADAAAAEAAAAGADAVGADAAEGAELAEGTVVQAAAMAAAAAATTAAAAASGAPPAELAPALAIALATVDSHGGSTGSDKAAAAEAATAESLDVPTDPRRRATAYAAATQQLQPPPARTQPAAAPTLAAAAAASAGGAPAYAQPPQPPSPVVRAALLPAAPSLPAQPAKPPPPLTSATLVAARPDEPTARALVVRTQLSAIRRVSALKAYLPQDLRPAAHRAAALDALRQLQLRFPTLEATAVDVVAQMLVGAPREADADADARADGAAGDGRARARTSGVHGAAEPHESADEADGAAPPTTPATGRKRVSSAAAAGRASDFASADDAQTASCKRRCRQLCSGFVEEMRCMRLVLRRLGHVDGDGIVTLKGRVAMEVDAADELLMAELLFDNTFATLSPAAAAALASCFIASEMEKPTATAVAAAKSLPDDLAGAHERLRAAATRIAAVLADARLGALDEGAGYTATFSSHLMPIVHAWTSGAEFAEICQLDEALFEGTIVRVIKRLDELLAELVGAAKVMGNEALAEKLEAARGAMHRDIVFSASLYTLEDG